MALRRFLDLFVPYCIRFYSFYIALDQDSIFNRIDCKLFQVSLFLFQILGQVLDLSVVLEVPLQTGDLNLGQLVDRNT